MFWETAQVNKLKYKKIYRSLNTSIKYTIQTVGNLGHNTVLNKTRFSDNVALSYIILTVLLKTIKLTKQLNIETSWKDRIKAPVVTPKAHST